MAAGPAAGPARAQGGLPVAAAAAEGPAEGAQAAAPDGGGSCRDRATARSGCCNSSRLCSVCGGRGRGSNLFSAAMIAPSTCIALHAASCRAQAAREGRPCVLRLPGTHDAHAPGLCPAQLSNAEVQLIWQLSVRGWCSTVGLANMSTCVSTPAENAQVHTRWHGGRARLVWAAAVPPEACKIG